jgi:hypothetical protein
MRSTAVLVLSLITAACASGGAGAGAGTTVSPTYNFTAVKSVYVQTPAIRLRSGGGGDTRALEITVADALREHLRREHGWIAARSPQEADLVAHFQLTDWEDMGDASRVGGTVNLESAANSETVFTTSSVYPSRFGAGAPGQPADNLTRLFESLFSPLRQGR